MDDRFSTMYIFGASSLAAAIQSLPGGVFRRRHHLTALPGLHLKHLSAKFPQKNPSISAASTSANSTSLLFESYNLARFLYYFFNPSLLFL